MSQVAAGASRASFAFPTRVASRTILERDPEDEILGEDPIRDVVVSEADDREASERQDAHGSRDAARQRRGRVSEVPSIAGTTVLALREALGEIVGHDVVSRAIARLPPALRDELEALTGTEVYVQLRERLSR